jgi:centrosomal protein CEP41
VYDEEETIGAKYATNMFQKGVDNVYLLSGGLRDMFEKFPEYVIGTLPPKPGAIKGELACLPLTIWQ